MRLRLIVALLLSSAVAPAQVWEKYVSPGLTYRMEVDLATPRLIHAFRYSLSSSTIARPELGGLKVYEDGDSKGRETLGDLVKRTGAIGGINADYFPFTGDPLGLMVRNGELVSLPMQKRAVFAWGREMSALGAATHKVICRPEGQAAFEVDGINQECGVNECCINADTAGAAIATKGPVVHAVVKLTEGTIAPVGRAKGVVQFLISDASNIPVQEGNVFITASGSKVGAVRSLRPGQRVTLEFSVSGFNWSKLEHAVGGGPFLLKNGQPAVDWSYQGFGPEFAMKRHPRTAMGRTTDGDLWFVAVDGRQGMSDGATLDEMAAIMLRLGCIDAINLDGGGSTTINLFGLTLNRPSDGQQRPVANAILLFGERPAEESGELSLSVPNSLLIGDVLTLKVTDSAGQPVANHDVLWGAQGKCWIDQGGTLRAVGEGDAWVFAQVRGKFLMATVKVQPRPAKALTRERQSALR